MIKNREMSQSDGSLKSCFTLSEIVKKRKEITYERKALGLTLTGGSLQWTDCNG